MAQQRRRDNRSEVRLATVVKAFLVCLLIGGVAIGYVLQSHENLRLIKERNRLYLELGVLQGRGQELEVRLSARHAPSYLEQMVVNRGLDLVRIRPEQVVELDVRSSEVPMIAQQGVGPSQESSSARRGLP